MIFSPSQVKTHQVKRLRKKRRRKSRKKIRRKRKKIRRKRKEIRRKRKKIRRKRKKIRRNQNQRNPQKMLDSYIHRLEWWVFFPKRMALGGLLDNNDFNFAFFPRFGDSTVKNVDVLRATKVFTSQYCTCTDVILNPRFHEE